MCPLLLIPLAIAAGPQSLTPAASQAWLRWLLPLPKRVSLTGYVSLPGSQIGLAAPDDETVQTAVSGLRELLGPVSGQLAFQIQFGLDAGVAGNVPKNAAQAYRIRPEGDARLVVRAMTEQGLWFGAQTVRQLLEGGRQGDTFRVPLVTIDDWPDLEERGMWGGSSVRDIEWLAAMKMNLVEAHVTLGFDDAGHATAQVDPDAVKRARQHGVRLVPILTHLDQLGRTGIYERYPELAGQGETARHKGSDVVAPCLSQPKMPEVLAEWVEALADNDGVTSICAWLSELHVQCGCDECKQGGQYALEAKALVRAARLARQKHPNLGFRILLTQGSYDTNADVLAEVPPDIGVTYYDGGRTYDSSRDPMIYPLLEDFAKQGRWLGVYPQVAASWRIVCPWSGPQFMKYRLTEFVDKGLTCLVDYATPDDRLYDFNVAASAEWSWNAHGRDEHEFAAAWATRKGYPEPDKVADWAVLLGPVGWDVYGSRVPYNAFFGGAANLVKGRKAPAYGSGMYRYFDSPDKLSADAEVCQQAMTIAERLSVPELIEESRVIGGYIGMLQAIAALQTELAGDADKDQLTASMQALTDAGVATSNGLRAWERACGGGGGTRFEDTVAVTEQTVSDIGAFLQTLGVPNPSKGLFAVKVGGWSTDDFEAEERIVKVYDVTDQLGEPGTYTVRFKYETGWNGLRMFKVALATAQEGRPDERAELSADEHEGTAAYRNVANEYTVELPAAMEPGKHYYLVAEIRGTRSSDKPENRRGCTGSVWMRQVTGE